MTIKVHMDTVRAAARALAQLPKIAPPQPEHVGKMLALQALRNEVRALKARGYTYQIIAIELSKLGIEVSPSAIKKSQSAEPVNKQKPIAKNLQIDTPAPAQPLNQELIHLADRGSYENN